VPILFSDFMAKPADDNQKFVGRLEALRGVAVLKRCYVVILYQRLSEAS
jgi:hypothetical protein